jgi:hypothetical protein
MINLEIGQLNSNQKAEIYDAICNTSIEDQEIEIFENFEGLNKNLTDLKTDIEGNDKYLLLTILETTRNFAYF